MNEETKALSQKFWQALEKSDTKTMRSIASPDCYFVHIGGNCDLDKEMDAFDTKAFQPTKITLHNQKVMDHGNTSIVVSDVDYGLLLDGKPTTHHFMTTEVFVKDKEWKLVQFTFTALVY